MIIVDAAARVRGPGSISEQSPLFRTLTGETNSSRARAHGTKSFGVPVTIDDLTSVLVTDSILPDSMFTATHRDLVLYVNARNSKSPHVPFVAKGKTFQNTATATSFTFDFTVPSCILKSTTRPNHVKFRLNGAGEGPRRCSWSRGHIHGRSKPH